MISPFDEFVLSMLSEATPPPAAGGAPSPGGSPAGDSAGGAPDMGAGDDLMSEIPDAALPEEKPVYPEELELAKLAIRALYFNVESKDVHNLKMRANGILIPFEKIPDYFEKTKNIIPVLGFVEWAMDRYEGDTSKWSEDREIKGKRIADKIKFFNKKLPEDERLDNGKRVYWVRIILNALKNGHPSFNLNISDVDEKNINEVFNLLKQHFGIDSRGIQPNMDDLEGPGVF